MKLIVAITGASGVIYAKRLLEVLREANIEVSVIISITAEKVIRKELGISKSEIQNLASEYFDVYDMEAPVASGSVLNDGMLIVPCTMATLAAIASGLSFNLITRTADVMLKESRPLVLVPRETPLSEVHLENMLRLKKMGVHIVPAMPAFYNYPQNIDDLVDFVVGRILDALKIKHKVYKRYLENHKKSKGV